MSKQKMWYCDHCGSSDLVRDAWVTVNHTEEEGESIIDSFDQCFCRTCEQTTHPIRHRVYLVDSDQCGAIKCSFLEERLNDENENGTFTHCTAKERGLKCVPFWLD